MLEQSELKRLEINDKFIFDCGDQDLNDFFHHDAIPHKRELVGVTYCYYTENNAMAFFTVSNDALKTKYIDYPFPENKAYDFYPAVKIGRLGVSKEYQGKGMGSQLLDYVKLMFTYENKTGCRYITIDAYNKEPQLNFYRKNGFSFLTQKDQPKETRLMYYDLKPFRDTLDQKIILDEAGVVSF
jgi:GNAT superfamily N-acetyltransferase